MTRTPRVQLQLATVGLGMIAFGTIASVLSAGISERVTIIVGRAVVVLGLCYLVTKGHRWAGFLLGVLTLVPGVTLLLTSVRAGWLSLNGLKDLLGAALFLGGYGSYFVAGGSRLFAPPNAHTPSVHGGA